MNLAIFLNESGVSRAVDNAQSLLSRAAFGLIRAREEISFRLERQRQRRQLLQLDADRLDDLGISRADALHEGRKGFCED